MLKEFTSREILIVELVHLLAYGTRDEMGYSLEEIVELLTAPIARKNGLNVLQCMHKTDREIIEELQIFLQSRP